MLGQAPFPRGHKLHVYIVYNARPVALPATRRILGCPQPSTKAGTE